MRKLIKTFVETVVEHFDNADWKQVSPALDAMDKIINEWSVSAAANILDVKVFDDQNSSRFTNPDGILEQRRSRRYVVLYETESRVIEATPLVPASITAPTVDVDIVEGTLKRRAKAMAGIFGVPEGFFLDANDPEAALIPLFSPDVRWETYKTLFGNLKHVS